MTKILRKLSFLLLSFSLIGLYSCNDDDDPIINLPTPTGTSTTFTLADVGAGISGTAIFTELSDNTTSIVIQLANTPAGGSHPAHIHMNSAAETGSIAVSLTPIDGSTGTSTTVVSALDNGTATTYAQLIAYDGYINVHLSAADLGTIVAQGDIGTNVLTGDTKVYPLAERAAPGISGTATFAKRVSGETLVTLALQNTPSGGIHPAHIHDNTALETGNVAFSLTSVDGTTGMSITNISDITYDELIAFDGYINVHLSADDLGTIVAQGDIGGNALTGNTKEYALNEKDVTGISGNVVFAERVDGTSLVTITLTGTPANGSHPAHIHNGTAAVGGPIAISLTSVNGDTGVSMTNVSALGNGTPITYTELLGFDGYINVHFSATDLGTIVAQGDVGKNG